MVQIIEVPKIDLVFKFTINESEARALDALAGYGNDAFIKAFYDLLGKAYMDKHEAGLRNFLLMIRQHVPAALERLDDARKAFGK